MFGPLIHVLSAVEEPEHNNSLFQQVFHYCMAEQLISDQHQMGNLSTIDSTATHMHKLSNMAGDGSDSREDTMGSSNRLP